MNFSTFFVLATTFFTFSVSASDSSSLNHELNELNSVFLRNQNLQLQAAPIKTQINQLQGALNDIESQYTKTPTVTFKGDIKQLIKNLSTENCQLKIVNQESLSTISTNGEKVLPHLVLTKVIKQAGQISTEWVAVPLVKDHEPLIIESKDMYSLNSGYAIHYRKGMQVITFKIEVRGNQSVVTATAMDEDHKWKTLICENQ